MKKVSGQNINRLETSSSLIHATDLHLWFSTKLFLSTPINYERKVLLNSLFVVTTYAFDCLTKEYELLH